jgi:NAD(P)-dependent dehydrogenase (short-subunit alcohol dehydrogenase family)
MCAQGFGRIINVGSVVSVKGYPLQAAYTASKHALLGMTKSLAAEYQDRGVRVSAVLPGGVDTDMARDARPDLDPDTLMSAEDVAEAVSYLLALSPRVCVDCIQLRRAGAAPF